MPQPCALAARSRPFVKWAGGKSQILGSLLPTLPASFGRYYEPFVGGGSVFFALAPRRATLADVNAHLIDTYRAVQAHVEALIVTLAALPHDRDTFYRVRALPWRKLGLVDRAARVLYLNRNCFNGLWRVNAQDEFNVPFGRNSQNSLAYPDTLRRAARALAGVRLVAGDVFALCRRVRRGDLVYFDPPYHAIAPARSFVGYSRPPFAEPQQRRLAALFARLAGRGVHVVLSNADTPLIRELYRPFRLRKIFARRAINRDPRGRGPVAELIITA